MPQTWKIIQKKGLEGMPVSEKKCLEGDDKDIKEDPVGIPLTQKNQ